jgi:methyl-accepting chemotaxis protein
VSSADVAREVERGVEGAAETDRAIEEMVRQVRAISQTIQEQLESNHQASDAVSGTTEALTQVARAMMDIEHRVDMLRQRIESLHVAPEQARAGAPANAGRLAELDSRPVPAA